ncbi:hypothetical protein [Flavicella marina]|uniref:hypothetical protein n=1 Tax=Flavicella marina TaxID=1475951 RepID=UPI00126457AD|nr:hypothetical protein [Flavicella marina]
MEALKLNNELLENKEFVEFLDSLLQEKLNSYNLELLVQCERIGNVDSNTLDKIIELKKIRQEIKEFKNLNNPEKLLSLISDTQFNTIANSNYSFQAAV